MKNDKFFHRGGFQNYSCGDHWLTIISNQKACFWNPSEPTILRPLSLMDRQSSNFFKRVSFHSTITTMSHRLIAESSLLTHMTNIFSSKNYFCFRKFSFFEIQIFFSREWTSKLHISVNLNIARTPLGAMDVQELTSCILQFSTATIFDEIKLQSSVLGQQGPNSPTQVSYIFDRMEKT